MERLNPFESRLKGRFLSIYSSKVQINFAGFPATTQLSGIDFVTTLPAAISTLLPTVTPGITNAPVPIYT